MQIVRIDKGQRDIARDTVQMLADVFNEQSDQFGEDYLNMILASNFFWVLSAGKDGQVVGGIIAHRIPLTHHHVDEMYIMAFGIRHEYRNDGIAVALMDELKTQAREVGIEYIYGAVDDSNTSAMKFYKSIGAEESTVNVLRFPAG